MIQILLEHKNNLTLADMAKIAIHAGCGWLILPDDNTDTLRAESSEIIEMSREEGVILTVRNNTDAARELGIHGVMLDKGQNPIAARGDLGADAIIGSAVNDASAAAALAMADIDYFILEPSQHEIIEKSRNAGVENHFVALCRGKETSKETIDELRAAGFSGICADSSIFDLDNPAAHIEHLTKSF